MNKKLIAPCGMNCGLCLHYLRANNKCPGCSSGRKVNGRCINCAIKLCKERKGEYCFDCGKFPCDRLKRMDQRYLEKEKWVNLDGTYCVHDKKRYK